MGFNTIQYYSILFNTIQYNSNGILTIMFFSPMKYGIIEILNDFDAFYTSKKTKSPMFRGEMRHRPFRRCSILEMIIQLDMNLLKPFWCQETLGNRDSIWKDTQENLIYVKYSRMYVYTYAIMSIYLYRAVHL